MDINKLSFHIERIIKKYTPKNKTLPKVVYPSLFDKLHHGLKSLVNDVLVSHPSAWNKYGIRIEPPNEFKKCIYKIPKEQIGEGFFGIVYKVPVKTCIKNIPKGTEYIAMKMEQINLNNSIQTPEKLKETISIANKIAELGIGPKLYDVFVVESGGTFYIVKIYEYIQGETWDVHKFKSNQSYTKAFNTLKQYIHTMNKHGILHTDLHTKNVMVSSSEKIYIIDFDLASYAENFEKHSIDIFNKNSDNRVVNDIEIYTRHVYNELIKQKIIKLPNKTYKK